jgi:PAS domain S-box-containing protein
MLKKNETIEMINPAVTTTFGYTPEQLLGHDISVILSSPKCSDLCPQFTLMRETNVNIL